ncbi:hypothetical protein CANCADRAFT_30445 [Tortispora caseinolytica NRRL Y-17796]|uniref:methylcrotonoyl-CoA carboxylase n=1 Tax=Tortispora caseinolytica NRRL Y-17796 TaxID=767744 RepID=A0A1E4TKE4_9ASCO|nr:hypothetical protein CANCADRAFT_30445 [Tortispora caseinolytica NRRL Y-17796]
MRSAVLTRPAMRLGRRKVHTYVASGIQNQMSVLKTKIDSSDPEFVQRSQAMKDLISELDQLHAKFALGGSEKARQKHISRNKLLVRDRIASLIDPGSAFLELSPLAGYELYPGEEVPSGGLVTGIGTISGVRCLIVANDATVKGGTYYPITVRKHLRAQEIAIENNLPCVYLVDSGGANLPHQSDVFPGHEHFGRIFFNQSTMSGKNIPQLSLVLGPCTAGGAYVPAMSDETIIVKGGGHIFLAGPPLVKAATGEVVSAEDLGGGEMHATVSGVVDHLVESEPEGIARMRQAVAMLNYPKNNVTTADPSIVAEPLYDPTEIDGVVGDNLRVAYDVREVISRIVDGSEFAEFKREYGTTLVTGWSKLYGHPIGILANQGPLFSESALKGAHFIELCKQRDIPLVFLQNISGFMVGSAAERGGIAKNGAKLVNAVVGSGVERFTVLIGGSYGAGNYGMCGRAYSPRFLFSWPNSRTAVMGAEQLASVMSTVGSKNAEATEKLRAQIESESDVKFGSARLWDDGIIKPSDTRRVLGLAIEASRGGRRTVDHKNFGVWRM